MTEVVTFAKQGRVGVITLDNPPVNALSHAVRARLCEVLANAFGDSSVEALVICCEGRTFIAGADIREFGRAPLAPDLPEVVEVVDGASRPVIAAIHGSALGGGLELALACHFRVAARSAKLGLPEVTLGILPGAGGTQRLPRLLGVRAALDMIVGGTPISAVKAHAIGLVDELVDGDLKAGALAFAELLLTEQRPFRRASDLTAELDDPNLFDQYAANIADKSRGLLAPFHCIRAVRAAVELPFHEGLKRERELFVELMASPQSKALRHAFFGEREVVKSPDLPDQTTAREVTSAAVIGGGPVGAEIAVCFADARIPVTLLDVSRAELDRSLTAIREHYGHAVAKGSLKQAESAERLERVRPALSYEELKDVDLVIEASSRDLAAARGVFAKLDSACKAGAILASNAPNLDVEQIADATTRPQNVMGMHFFAPARATRLLANVRARATAVEVCATAMKLGKTLGKLPVLVRAGDGFFGTRMLAQYSREALLLLEEGALPEQVDRVLRGFGFPVGPFSAADLEGLDEAFCDRKAKVARLTAREKACDILDRMYEQKRLGLKTGTGFYRYDDQRVATPDPAIEALLSQHSEERGIIRREIPDLEILERCLYALINEGARVLEQGIAARPLEIDMIWIHGYGFPAHRGGPMFYADQTGLGSIEEAILGYRRRLGAGDWTPAPLLERLAKAGKGFYAAS